MSTGFHTKQTQVYLPEFSQEQYKPQKLSDTSTMVFLLSIKESTLNLSIIQETGQMHMFVTVDLFIFILHHNKS